MADTAAFFASKKKKGTKKKFKSFNANKIDANSVLSSTHVDAPEMSEGISGLSLGGTGNNDDWDESHGVVWGNNVAAISGADSKVSELLDMEALEFKRNEEDDVAERLRVEETKAQLARAKEGMAKEAERLAAEKAEMEAKAAERAAGPATGGRWVPSRMAAGATIGGGLSSTNEELFPDLAAADKILAEKERQEEEERKRIASSQPIRAPSGWGSRMGGNAATAAPAQRKPLNLAPPPAERKPLNLTPPAAAAADKPDTAEPEAAEPEAADTKETVVEKIEEDKPATETPAAPAATPAAAPATTTPTPAPEKKVLKKKKKKDLSTFKA